MRCILRCASPALPSLAQDTCGPSGSGAHFRQGHPAVLSDASRLPLTPPRAMRCAPALCCSMIASSPPNRCYATSSAPWPPCVIHSHLIAGKRIPCPPSAPPPFPLSALRCRTRGPLSSTDRRSLHPIARPAAIERRGQSPVGGSVPSTPDRTGRWDDEIRGWRMQTLTLAWGSTATAARRQESDALPVLQGGSGKAGPSPCHRWK